MVEATAAAVAVAVQDYKRPSHDTQEDSMCVAGKAGSWPGQGRSKAAMHNGCERSSMEAQVSISGAKVAFQVVASPVP